MGKRRAGPDDRAAAAAERRHGAPVAGVDEAGRGPWAGPVVAAAVILDRRRLPAGLDDSKALSPRARERLFKEIMAAAMVGVGSADAAEIDRVNILAATLAAMTRAVDALGVRPAAVLVDGNRAPETCCPAITIVGGDASSLSIAAASIIAKVTRDRIMRQIADAYPGYGFERHKGYGTAGHADAIERLGVTPVHRRSFAPVRLAIERAGANERQDTEETDERPPRRLLARRRTRA